MNRLRILLGSLRDRWDPVRSGRVWAGVAVVVAAWGLIALGRLGGLAIDAPRALTRLTVVGVWGWFGLGIAIWAIAVVPASSGSRRVGSLTLTFAVVGLSHAPIIMLAGVILIAAGALEVLGPGRAVAAISLVVVMPLALITGVAHIFEFSTRRAAATVLLPYAAWLAVVVRPSLEQVEHLL